MEMEDSKFKKIIIISLIILFLLSVFSVGSVVFLYKKIALINFSNFSSTQVADQNQPPDMQESQIGQVAKNATGFLGLPTGEAKSGVESNLKKFELKGHWIFKDNPGFDYMNKEEKEKVTIIANENTKIYKLIAPADKNQKPAVQKISFNDFKIESQNNPYLAVFDQSASSSFLVILAKEIRIFPIEVK